MNHRHHHRRHHRRKTTADLNDDNNNNNESELDGEELEELKQLFSVVDADGGGTIDSEEFIRFVRMLNVKAPDDIVFAIFNEIDTDSGGTISFDEFLEFMKGGKIRQFNLNHVMDAFDAIGDRYNGYVSIESIARVLKSQYPDIYPTIESVKHITSHMMKKDADDTKIEYTKYLHTVL